MRIEKALILSGRDDAEAMWPASLAGPRQLFPIANRPILFHGLEALAAAGVVEATILADGESGAAIRDAVGDGEPWGMSLRHGEWQSADGITAALASEREFLGDAPVFVQQGSALMREQMDRHIAAFALERLDALALRLAGPVSLANRGSAQGYLLSSRAVSMLADRPETGANPVVGVREQGGRVRVQRVEGLLPCTDLDALLNCNRALLEGLTATVDAESLPGCSIQGQVIVDPTAEVERSMLRGPLIIGPNARITDAYIGPYTSIGAGVTLEGAEIEHSIVLPNAELRFIGTRLESSVIGRGARVVRGFSLPNTLRMSIGDGAEVVLR